MSSVRISSYTQTQLKLAQRLLSGAESKSFSRRETFEIALEEWLSAYSGVVAEDSNCIHLHDLASEIGELVNGVSAARDAEKEPVAATDAFQPQ